MATFRFGHLALSLAAAVAIFAACGGRQAEIPPGTPDAPGSALQREARSSAGGPLLYVARGHDTISIVSLRDGKAVAQITGYGYPTGICSDPAGNIWVPNYRSSSNDHYHVDEFAHGGTKAIVELRAPNGVQLAGCAVDPSSGDLVAVAYNTVLIWRGARKGKPVRYSVDFAPLFAAYDNAGNLFITGWAGGSDWWFVMAELPNGSAKFRNIHLDKHIGEPGDVQWDGKYVVVSTAVSRRTGNPFGQFWVARLYRLQISGSTGHVEQIVEPRGLKESFRAGMLFALQGRSIIGLSGKRREDLGTWPYPAGGKATSSIAHYRKIHGLAISQ